jgi:hypothetical protein
MRFLPTAIAAAALLAITPAHGTNIFVTTGTGTETATISEGNPLSWIFTAMPPYTSFQAGVFAMKMEAGTSHGIRLELFDIVNASVVDSVTLSADDVAAAGGNALSYERIVFSLPVAFSSGDSYQLTLSVTDNPAADPDTGSYTVRGSLGMFGFVEEETTTVIALATGPTAVDAPEPAAALVMAAALLGLAGTRRRAA